ncbi:Gibberellin 2-beta-dioxygenase 8 [Senna tora]|uniref:Gibberellin 2-beta-dioxygenase 8 n=1 Tax=Senna tora TaxID=362788 RepID=A0A834WWM9_9FABA|nr:Gibberellin 2-beta-dioxygenase 8 [Senna tora]
MDYEPPLLESYKKLVQNPVSDDTKDQLTHCSVVETWEVPLIDFGRLLLDVEREKCVEEMVEACRQWGLFQVVNHGISLELLERMKLEQMKLFHQPFVNKSQEMVSFFNNINSPTYRWGNPFATHLTQLSWSEAFHISLEAISTMDHHTNLRECIEGFSRNVGHLAESIVEILAHKVFGLLPHTDSSFITIVYQDQVGGLQFMKDGKWFGVKPNPQALTVNIGDLFQALSNGEYRSTKHRVVAAEKIERFSVAYFYCPSDDAMIESYSKPAMYRKFTFKEYRQQTEKDVKQIGDKVGLSSNDQPNTNKEGQGPVEDLTPEQWMSSVRACCPQGPIPRHLRGRLAKELSEDEEFLRSVCPPSNSIVDPTSVPMEAGDSANSLSSYLSASEYAEGPSPPASRVSLPHAILPHDPICLLPLKYVEGWKQRSGTCVHPKSLACRQ